MVSLFKLLTTPNDRIVCTPVLHVIREQQQTIPLTLIVYEYVLLSVAKWFLAFLFSDTKWAVWRKKPMRQGQTNFQNNCNNKSENYRTKLRWTFSHNTLVNSIKSEQSFNLVCELPRSSTLPGIMKFSLKWLSEVRKND